MTEPSTEPTAEPTEAPVAEPRFEVHEAPSQEGNVGDPDAPGVIPFAPNFLAITAHPYQPGFMIQWGDTNEAATPDSYTVRVGESSYQADASVHMIEVLGLQPSTEYEISVTSYTGDNSGTLTSRSSTLASDPADTAPADTEPTPTEA